MEVLNAFNKHNFSKIYYSHLTCSFSIFKEGESYKVFRILQNITGFTTFFFYVLLLEKFETGSREFFSHICLVGASYFRRFKLENDLLNTTEKHVTDCDGKHVPIIH